eukprot:6188585-Pleurochrysis_carterae.AAC.3
MPCSIIHRVSLAVIWTGNGHLQGIVEARKPLSVVPVLGTVRAVRGCASPKPSPRRARCPASDHHSEIQSCREMGVMSTHDVLKSSHCSYKYPLRTYPWDTAHSCAILLLRAAKLTVIPQN